MQTDPKDLNQGVNSGAGNIDLNNILLPKKDIPPASTERVNAGVLLEQEQTATLPKVETPPPPPAPPKKPEDTGVQPLQTYKGDIEQLVHDKNLSVVTIAAAEAQRRGPDVQAAQVETIRKAKDFGKTLLLYLGGLLFLAAAGGGLAYVFLRETPTAQIIHNPQAPFIMVDSTEIASLQPGALSRTSLMAALQGAREKVALSLGLMARLYPAAAATSTDSAPVLINIQTMLTTLSSSIPDELVRSIDPRYYTLGVHSFDENQVFLIMRVDSYQQAYAGMLAWERTMYADLNPLFKRTPRPRSADEQATTTPPVQLLPTAFIDRVVENHDARVIQNEARDILLMWTFLDRSTLVIATNEHTLREIINRFTDITLLPQI